MTKVRVFAGECGYMVTVKADKIDNSIVSVSIQSRCDMLNALNDALARIDYQKVCTSWADCLVFQAVNVHVRHNDCPVPAAIVKAIAVEMGAAKPRDMLISFEHDIIQVPHGFNPQGH